MMGVTGDVEKVDSWDVEKSKGKTKKNNNNQDEAVTGCWIKFKLIGNCISSRSKVDSSISGLSTQCVSPCSDWSEQENTKARKGISGS